MDIPCGIVSWAVSPSRPFCVVDFLKRERVHPHFRFISSYFSEFLIGKRGMVISRFQPMHVAEVTSDQSGGIQ